MAPVWRVRPSAQVLLRAYYLALAEFLFAFESWTIWSATGGMIDDQPVYFPG